jgi:hypothetical protein
MHIPGFGDIEFNGNRIPASGRILITGTDKRNFYNRMRIREKGSTNRVMHP